MANNTVYDVLEQAASQRLDQPFCVERKRFRRKVWTYGELLETAERIATLLRLRGIVQGDKIGICAPNGPYWLGVYIACARLGIVIVPIDVNSAENFVRTIAEKTDMLLLFKTIYKPLTNCKVEQIELEQLIEILPERVNFKAPEVKADDILEIVFTSGSTGDPKGVVLTHRNITSNLASLRKTWDISDNHRLLSMIPLSHMFEQTVGFLVPFAAGSQVVYVQSVRPFQVIQALLTENITTIVTVPAFLSLLRRRILEQAEEHNFIRQLKLELRLAELLPRSARRYMFQGLLLKMGPDLRLVAVGGAPLATELEQFWEMLDIRVVQGYGLTETSPIATYSSPRNKRSGSVGRCLPGQKLKLADDNEILLAGNNVFSGYYKDPTGTAKTLHDGWYHTGDIGRLDKDGYLYVTGRKKNMLLGESGLNVYPEDIESALANHVEIRDSVVMLQKVQGREVLTAVLLTDTDEARVATVIKTVNAGLAAHQTIQHTIRWQGEDFPRTPTRKIKRQQIIDELKHAGPDTAGASQPLLTHAAISRLTLLVAGVASIAPDKVSGKSNLVSDLGFDSLKRLELVSKIEEELGAYLEEASIDGNTTVEKLESLVDKATRAPKPRLFSFSFFETFAVTSVRLLSGWPLLLFASYYQRLQFKSIPLSSEPVVYVANHTSHFDALTLLRILPLAQRRKIMIGAAQDYFFKNRLQGFLLRLIVPVIPIDRQGNIQYTLLQLGSFLNKGFSIVLFPEGTRSTTGKMLPFKPGIGVIAQELEVPIVAMKITGNDSILPKGRKWPRRGTTHIRTAQPMVFGRDGDYQSTTKEIEEVVAEL